ncbi:transposase [Bacteroidota bacterium]
MSLRGRSYLSDETFSFITTTIVNHYPIFNDEMFCDILLNNIKHYQEKYKFEILGYVIMPSHLHWIVNVNPIKATISDIMRDIKKYSAKQMIELLYKMKRNKVLALFKHKAQNFLRQNHKIWEQRFFDEIIRNDKMFWAKLKYIHNNPVEANLVKRVEDYKYSSARNYLKNDHSIIFVNTEYAGVEFKCF